MKYIRLNITAEGQTELEYAKRAIADHLVHFQVTVDSRCVMTSKSRHKMYRGGLLDYAKAKKDLQNWMREDQSPEVRFTTMFDLYALPDDFPGFAASMTISDPYQRVKFLENALSEDINDLRFIPYLQLHEFEALLFTKIELLMDAYPWAEKEVAGLKALLAQYGENPELINTGRTTAPSKKIIAQIPEYDGNKVSVGAPLVELIGIPALKKTCIHFGEWMTKLEELSA